MRESKFLISFGSGPSVVNGLHDFLGPPHRVRDCADSRWNSFPAIELCQLARSEELAAIRSTRLRPSSTLGSLSYSRFVRLKNHRCEITGVKFWAGLLSH